MERKRHIFFLAASIAVAIMLFALSGFQVRAEPSNKSPHVSIFHGDAVVIKRTSQMEMYSCSDCHSEPEDFNPRIRELKEEHLERVTYHPSHSEDSPIWCLSCHMENRYTRLRLKDGTPVSFNSSYRLCGECHGVTYEAWKNNAHGKRIGNWKGRKEIYSCLECHNAHDPKFKPMESVAAPTKRTDTTTFLRDLTDRPKNLGEKEINDDAAE